MDYVFDFEKLDVYKLSIEFINKVFNISLKFKQIYQSSLGDQIRRASLSIATNIAEGNGKYFIREKIKYFTYSLDSAKECIPLLTVGRSQNQIDEGTHQELREDCSRICQMLLKLIKSISPKEPVSAKI